MPWIKDGNVGIDRPDIKVFETYHNYIFQVFTSNACITINILLKSVDNIEIQFGAMHFSEFGKP